MDKKIITEKIQDFILQYQPRHSTETEWRRPLVGFASAEEALFSELKRVVSPSHVLPKDLLPTVRTVVAFFLPFGKPTAESNNSGVMASRKWAQAYVETNALINAIGLHMKQYLESEGYDVVATPPTHNFDPEILVSNWSHRHVAFIAGLGRFGLNNMLITESGCCGRIGSFLTSAALPGDRRSSVEACLYRHDGSCKQCVSRCVGDALFSDRFNRHNCYQICLKNKEHYKTIGEASVCGKCLVAVPCTFVDPVKTQTSKAEQPA